MGVVEDVRKVIQDLVTPDLRALTARMDALEQVTEVRFQQLSDRVKALADLVDVSYRALNAKMEANHATVMNALNIDKRLEALERAREEQRHPA